MEEDPDQKTKNKRKLTESPTFLQEPTTKKKPLQHPTTTDQISTDEDYKQMTTATKAASYASELVQTLADEYYGEDHIGSCLSKVYRALEQVCNALQYLSSKRNEPSTVSDPKPQSSESQRPKSPTSSTTGIKAQVPPTQRTKRSRKKKQKLDSRTPSHGPIATATAKLATPAETEQQSAEPPKPPTDIEAPFTTVSRPVRKAKAPTPQPAKRIHQRPAAVLVKVGEGRTYADTLRAVRNTVIDFDAMGTHVTAMRKTLKGDLLVELTKGAKAVAATSTIRNKLAEITGTVVTRLRHIAEVEIIDLDEVTTQDEVLAAIRKSLYGDDLPDDDEVKVTGLWSTRDGRQMATAIVGVADASKLTSIRVGWTQCRVRPRRPEPPRCYQCHGFGHSTRQCTGPDMSTACRRCGLTGHTQATCTESEDRCVACDRLKAPRVPHKPGSGACAARRKAISEMNANRQK